MPQMIIHLLSFVARYFGVNTVFIKVFCQVIYLVISGLPCLSSYVFYQAVAVENFGQAVTGLSNIESVNCFDSLAM